MRKAYKCVNLCSVLNVCHQCLYNKWTCPLYSRTLQQVSSLHAIWINSLTGYLRLSWWWCDLYSPGQKEGSIPLSCFMSCLSNHTFTLPPSAAGCLFSLLCFDLCGTGVPTCMRCAWAVPGAHSRHGTGVGSLSPPSCLFQFIIGIGN
jgi:hypothetical protein